jgi:two-component system sensor histidine kinase UhpB
MKASTPDAPTGRPEPRGIVARLLSVPLFYKILVANAIIVLVFTLLATWLAVLLGRVGTPLGPMLAVAVGGALVSVAVNAVIIQLALAPLSLLKRTADEVQGGNMDSRVEASPLADREMRQLTEATNAMLDRLAEYRRRLRDVAGRALNAAEDERRRISLELHDDASQRLAAILMRLRLARGAEDEVAKDAILDEVRQELAEAAEGLRRYAQGLRPPALDELGLGAAIESHVRHVGETSEVPVEFRTDGVGRLESPEAELALYRIVQEAISNALRHARPRTIRVAVDRYDGVVMATIIDDGIGFDVEAVLESTDDDHGLGLFGMQERAEYVGGAVEVTSAPGEGTTVRAAVPERGAGTALPPGAVERELRRA